MLRRILIIILVVIVIIAAIFAIRWILNRDSGEAATQPDGIEVTAIVDDSTTVEETTVVDEGVIQPDAGEVDQTPEETGDAVPPTVGYPPASAEGDTTQAVEASPDAESTTPKAEDSAAQAPAIDDPEAGGGVPKTEGAAVVVIPEDAGIGGGIGDVAASSPLAAFVQPGVPTQHTVQNLEWLTQLARCYGTTVADIQAANNYACPDLIHPGWVVNIANPGNAGPITINETPCFNYHTVQQGETLYSIAAQYGISYQWLARINAIYNYNYIYAGQQLVIPNPVNPVFTQVPAEPFFYSNCWNNYCPVYPVQPIYPVPVPDKK
ncbi:MAG: LysM peptidoglycan-binding domain-containing protein [Chloroflexi bacterium]|nr:LysM peptidoglycan-binding domain-containing protein [Chloroflexota bacterium]